VVYESSPYFAGTSSGKSDMWDVKQEVGEEPPVRTEHPNIVHQAVRPVISNSEIKTWLPRGFAVVHSDAPGTGLSQGCVTVGGAVEELAPKAVIDWLNGRAKGYTSKEGSEEVVATWATGKVGMVGTSYNGTLALAAATTGVQGLEAIIPTAPNTSYYHYYRSNGLIRHPGGWLGEDIDSLYDFVNSGDPAFRPYCNNTIRDGKFAAGRDRAHGDYNSFWAERDLLTKIKGVKAASLLSQGQNDWNVMPEHSIRIYEALKNTGAPAQLFLHLGGHGGQPPLEMRNRWFSHYLYGVDNGIEKDPRSMIVREGGDLYSSPTAYAQYPNPAASAVRVLPYQGGLTKGGLGVAQQSDSHIEKLIDDVQFSGADLAKLKESKNRLLYATLSLKEDLHLSGTPVISIKLAANKPAANLSVWLVTLPFDETAIGAAGMRGVVSRGWADPQNHAALKHGGNYDSQKNGTPIVPDQFYQLTFDMQPSDRVIPAGKRLALMIMSSDREFTVWPKAGTELSIDLKNTSILLPVVGGENAFRKAAGG
jgi:X-Pro dipeptidyl-peptidase